MAKSCHHFPDQDIHHTCMATWLHTIKAKLELAQERKKGKFYLVPQIPSVPSLAPGLEVNSSFRLLLMAMTDPRNKRLLALLPPPWHMYGLGRERHYSSALPPCSPALPHKPDRLLLCPQRIQCEMETPIEIQIHHSSTNLPAPAPRIALDSLRQRMCNMPEHGHRNKVNAKQPPSHPPLSPKKQ